VWPCGPGPMWPWENRSTPALMACFTLGSLVCFAPVMVLPLWPWENSLGRRRRRRRLQQQMAEFKQRYERERAKLASALEKGIELGSKLQAPDTASGARG
jgi:hypothetical protein